MNVSLQLFKTAYRNLESTTMRTLLAMLGILVGTAAVVAMVSTGQMATEEALRQFKNLGTDLIALSLSNKNTSESGAKKFDLEDALAIKNASADIEVVAPYTIIYSDIMFNGNKINGAIIGATDSLANIMHIELKHGRFISPLDHYEQLCVVGHQIYQQLLHYTSQPLGSKIKLGEHIYTIVGVEEVAPESSFLYQDINNSIIIPIRTTGFLMQHDGISNIVARLAPHTQIPTVKNAIEHHISVNTPNKEIFFRSAQELIKSMEAQHRIFTLLLALIGSISLIVGGIGVMNIMLVSVLERRREIGIRLALGARRKEIQQMFLTESILLSAMGGALGIMIGILFSFIIAKFSHWQFMLFFLPPFIGFTVSVLIGIFFGFYPAYKAAKLDPIQTLRSE